MLLRLVNKSYHKTSPLVRKISTTNTTKKSIEFTRRNQLEHQIYFDQFSLIAPRERFPYAGNYNRLTTERQLNELQAGLLKDTGTIGPVTTSLLSVETVQIPNQSTIQTINSWLSSKTKETQQERTFYSGQPISKVIDMIHSIEKGAPDFRGTFVADKRTAERYADKNCLILAFSVNPLFLRYNIFGYGEIDSCNTTTQLLAIIGIGRQAKRAPSAIRDGVMGD